MPKASPDIIQFIGVFNNWAVNQARGITLAMSTEAQWEVWLQVEIAVYFLTNFKAVVVREVKYDGSQKSVDLIIKINGRAIAVELKAESLKTGLVSGTTMAKALNSDTEKLKNNRLKEQFNSMACKEWSSVVIGIGQVSHYAAAAAMIIGAESTCVKYAEDFGVYVTVVEESN